MSVKIDIRDAIVLTAKDGEPVKYKLDKDGKEIGTFVIGCKKYDPNYKGNFRYNNFFVVVPHEEIDRIKRLHLSRNSMVHLLADFDYSKDVLEAREQQGDSESPEWGKSRSVNGVVLTLIDIEFAGTTSAKNEEGEAKKEITESQAKSAELKMMNFDDISLDEHAENAEDEVAAEFRENLEDKYGIPSVNLDDDDIFGRLKSKAERKFF